MSSGRLSRRTLLGAAGGAAAATALPVVPALSSLLAEAAATDPQTNLSNLVNMRFGMFNHFGLGTFTNEEWAAPSTAFLLPVDTGPGSGPEDKPAMHGLRSLRKGADPGTVCLACAVSVAATTVGPGTQAGASVV